MSTLFYVLLILAPAAILATAYAIIKKRNQGRSIKRSVAVNLATFAVLTVLIAALSVSVFAADDNNASAADASAATTATETVDNSKGMGLLAAGLVTGLAGIGGGIAVAVIVLEPDGDGNVLLTGDGRGRHANGLRAGQVDLAIGHRGVAG